MFNDEAVNALNQGKCPIYPALDYNNQHYILCARSRVLSTKMKDGVMGKEEVADAIHCHAIYIPVSNKAWNRLLLQYYGYMVLEALIATITVVSLALYLFQINPLVHNFKVLFNTMILPAFCTHYYFYVYLPAIKLKYSKKYVKPDDFYNELGLPAKVNNHAYPLFTTKTKLEALNQNKLVEKREVILPIS
jgi:hypothetical protein